MLKLQFPPFSDPPSFPGLKRGSLILPRAGLFVSSSASQRGALLIFHRLSCFLLPGPAGPNWTRVPIWSPCCSGCRHTFLSLETLVAAKKTTVMISGNVPIRKPFALHSVSVTLHLTPASRVQACAVTGLISPLTVPLQQQETGPISKSDRQQPLGSSNTQKEDVQPKIRNDPQREGDRQREKVRRHGSTPAPV